MNFKKLLFSFLLLTLTTVGWGQVNMTTTGSHTQNFNTLSNSGSSNIWTDNSTISNWYSQRTGSGTTYAADAGGATAGNQYSYGSSSASDRALGSLGSSNTSAGSFAHGVLLKNTSGNTITDIKVTYTLEEWRKSGVTTAQDITFWYKISSSAISTLNPNSNSGWIQVTGLTLSSPINTSTGSALDGNLATNKVTATNISIPSLSLDNNYYIMLKWEDPDHTGSDHGLAIDDVTINWTVASSTPTITTSTTSLTAFSNTCINTYSVEKTFTVTGLNLTDNIIITPPAGFEISTTSGSGFVSNPSTLSISGSVSDYSIYVRFAPTAATAYSGNITLTSTGATQQNVSVSGTGINTAPTVTTPTSTAITATTAIVGGNITSIGCSNATVRGIEWSTTSGFANGSGTQVSASGSFSTGTFTQAVTGLPAGTIIYFHAFATNDGGTSYSAQGSFTTLKAEPSNFPTAFTCGTTTDNTIPLSWTAATGTVLPDGYLIKWSNVSYAAIADPVDGVAEANGATTQNTTGTSYTATGLSTTTTYYFKIWSYTNSGTGIDYKLTGEPQTSCTTVAGPCLREGFNNGTTAPSGWTFTSIGGTYTTATNYGIASPSLTMDATNDRIETPSVSNASQLSFWIKGQGTNTTSALLVEGYNGSSWVIIQNITNSIPTTGTTYTYNSSTSPALPSGLTKFRFTYTKSVGNLAFDDVVVYCGQEINVTGNSVSITDGDLTPSATDDTDFGDVLYAGTTSVTHTYTIENEGGTDLTVSAISSSNVPEFAVSASLPMVIAPGSNATFTVTFDPSTYGIRTSTISITNDDLDENPYTFAVQGNGTSTDTVDWCNLQWPPTGNLVSVTTFNVYTRVYEAGVTNANGQGSGIRVWIGYNSTNSDPSTWTNWIEASYSGDTDGISNNDNDEYILDLGTPLPAGTYYYASRVQLNGGPYKYGGTKSDLSGGGDFWNGTSFISGFLTIDIVDWCNIQTPLNGTITLGGGFDVYTQIYEDSLTPPSSTEDSEINAELGYSLIDNDPSNPANAGNWTWISGSHNAACGSCGGNNDEYIFNLGAAIGSSGTYYYASRFQINSGPYAYGGFNGGFWNNTYTSGTGNRSGQLVVQAPAEINVAQNVTSIASGGTYNFGNVLVGSSSPVIFTIENTGDLNLSITTPLSASGDYTVTTQPSNTVTGHSSTTFTVTFSPSVTGTRTGSVTITNNDSNEGSYVINFTGVGTSTAESDIVTAGGESATVSSLENDATITTTADGVQVWQFTIRDGGADLTDGDSLPTILTGITFTQNAGNAMDNWSDAILACALFDGTTLVSNTPIITTNQIQFSGLSFSVADGTSKTLSLRISIQTSPNDSGSNNDGDDFVFNITNTYVTASASGSAFAAFSSTNSTNGLNVFEVIATQLSFSVQPTDVGVGSVMSPAPQVSATDANGNIDLDYTGSISVSSTGTATVTIPVTAIAGVSSFTDIIHTVSGTGISLTASASGLTSATSATFNVYDQTVLSPGDLAILAVNTNIGTSGEDQIAFVCFKDLSPGTKIYLTDNGYEREYAGEWGGTEGVISITRTGSVLPKGTIIVFQSTTSNVTLSSHYDIYTCGVADTNWTKSGSPGSGFNLNSDDDVWIMQGGTWTNDTSHHSTYDGNVLYGWTESGWDTGVGTIGDPNGTKWSALYPGANCFTTIAPVGVGKVKFNDPDINGDFTSTTNARLDWIALINTTSNWDTYTDNTTYNAGGYDYKGNSGCPQMTIVTDSYVNGVWTGRTDENWFNCENWETFVVPDETVNVTIPGTASHEAIIDHLATDSDFYGDLAKTKNMTIEGGIWVEANTSSDILEVHGDLTIENNGQLDLNGSGDGGVLKLYGNWTNNYDEVNGFDETNSTVHFVGTVAQTVTCNGGVEHFYNVVLNNPTDFTTDSFNSDLYAAGSLTMTQGNLTVKSGHYALAGKDLTVGIGTTLDIENEGSLVQTDDSGIVTNNGTTIVHRTTSPYIQYDYTYFSSPIVNETVTDALSPFSPLYYLDAGNYLDEHNSTSNSTTTTGFPQLYGTPDGFDDAAPYDWQTATGFMTPGVGYIGRGNTAKPSGQAVTFTAAGADGRLNNGVINVTVEKDAYTVTGTEVDDFGAILAAKILNSNNNANLIGNPYPSALSLVTLYNNNASVLTGTFYFWTHSTAPSTGITGPWLYNYDANDFATYNATGIPFETAASVNGGATPTGGYVASGQGFIALMNEEYGTDTGTLQFNNSQRGVPTATTYTNNQFFRQASTVSDRIWLNLQTPDNESRVIALGFENGASDAYDAYDSPRMENGHANDFYSLITPTDAFKLAIQRLEPFTEDKIIPLGMELNSSGTCQIMINHAEGIFSESQRVYLEDKSLNIIHDLSLGAYTFTQTSGDNINNRFVLRFNTNALATDEHLLQDLTLYPNPSKGVFYINYTGTETLEIEVFDVLGKQVLKRTNTNIVDLSAFNSGIYLAKFTTPSGSITKKLVRE